MKTFYSLFCLNNQPLKYAISLFESTLAGQKNPNVSAVLDQDKITFDTTIVSATNPCDQNSNLDILKDTPMLEKTILSLKSLNGKSLGDIIQLFQSALILGKNPNAMVSVDDNYITIDHTNTQSPEKTLQDHYQTMLNPLPVNPHTIFRIVTDTSEGEQIDKQMNSGSDDLSCPCQACSCQDDSWENDSSIAENIRASEQDPYPQISNEEVQKITGCLDNFFQPIFYQAEEILKDFKNFNDPTNSDSQIMKDAQELVECLNDLYRDINDSKDDCLDSLEKFHKEVSAFYDDPNNRLKNYSADYIFKGKFAQENVDEKTLSEESLEDQKNSLDDDILNKINKMSSDNDDDYETESEDWSEDDFDEDRDESFDSSKEDINHEKTERPKESFHDFITKNKKVIF